MANSLTHPMPTTISVEVHPPPLTNICYFAGQTEINETSTFVFTKIEAHLAQRC